jgi:hypothetical protein
MEKERLKEILRKHALWLANEKGGEQANLQGANLREADLQGANLREADLRIADLRGANLQEANLQGTSLWGATLRGANLRGASLRGTVGNMNEVKSLQIEIYPIAYTKDVLQIGCENHSFESWRRFTDDQINEMDKNALSFWRKFKDLIFQIIELSPAS